MLFIIVCELKARTPESDVCTRYEIPMTKVARHNEQVLGVIQVRGKEASVFFFLLRTRSTYHNRYHRRKFVKFPTVRCVD